MSVKYPNGQEPNYIYCSKDSKGKKYRYLLGRIEEGKVPAVMICMNPSKADLNQSDQTVNKLIKYFGNNGWVMLNLYCGYETKPKNIKFDFNEMNKNIAIIRAFLKLGKGSEVPIVFTQWGNLESRQLRYCEHEILKILKETKKKAFFFGELTLSGNPRHLNSRGQLNANDFKGRPQKLKIY